MEILNDKCFLKNNKKPLLTGQQQFLVCIPVGNATETPNQQYAFVGREHHESHRKMPAKNQPSNVIHL